MDEYTLLPTLEAKMEGVSFAKGNHRAARLSVESILETEGLGGFPEGVEDNPDFRRADLLRTIKPSRKQQVYCGALFHKAFSRSADL